MEYFMNCCICGAPVKTIYKEKFIDILGMARKYEQHIGLCDTCGFIFTQNPFSATLLENRYKVDSKFEYDAEDYDFGYETSMSTKRQLNLFREHDVQFNSVLEVGAASGANLSKYECRCKMGIEPSAFNCYLAEKKYGLKMFNGMFDEYIQTHQESYDLIVLSMVLEHIVNPFSFIKKLRDINNTYIYIYIPSMDVKFINEPFGMFAEEHVNYFTFEGLNSLMAAAGYGLVDAKVEYEPDLRCPAGVPSISSLWEKDKPQGKLRPVFNSREILEKYIEVNTKELETIKKKIDLIPKKERLAIWGTGHHVSMLLANTSLHEKNIVKFYDSDDKKHKYTMLEKEIVSFNPKDIESGEVEGIFIGTYVFQEAIYGILKQYHKQCHIYKLYEDNIL